MTTTPKVKWLRTPEAKKMISDEGFGKISHWALIRWIDQYSLGRKIGGRWFINEARLLAFLRGELEKKGEGS